MIARHLAPYGLSWYAWFDVGACTVGAFALMLLAVWVHYG